jgi:hypothetical protein
MGFFSWDCKACGHSVRAVDATNSVSEWLSQAVLVEPDGSTIRGSYDGYGRLETRSGREMEVGEGRLGPCLYHQACYDLMGKPSYDKPSRSANDQGFFVGEYDPKKPHCREDVDALNTSAKERAEADRAKAHEENVKYAAELTAKGETPPEWLQRMIESGKPSPVLISMAKAGERG